MGGIQNQNSVRYYLYNSYKSRMPPPPIKVSIVFTIQPQSTHFRWVWSMPLFGIASNFAFFCPQIFPQLSYPDTSLAAAPVATEKPQINPQGGKKQKKKKNIQINHFNSNSHYLIRYNELLLSTEGNKDLSFLIANTIPLFSWDFT